MQNPVQLQIAAKWDSCVNERPLTHSLVGTPEISLRIIYLVKWLGGLKALECDIIWSSWMVFKFSVFEVSFRWVTKLFCSRRARLEFNSTWENMIFKEPMKAVLTFKTWHPWNLVGVQGATGLNLILLEESFLHSLSFQGPYKICTAYCRGLSKGKTNCTKLSFHVNWEYILQPTWHCLLWLYTKRGRGGQSINQGSFAFPLTPCKV